MELFNRVARLVVRDEGRDNQPRLILGSLMKDQTFFKKGRVYEVVEVMGELTIREVGPCCIAGEGERVADSPVGVTWASSVNDVLGYAGKALFLTRAEVEQHRAANLPESFEDD